MLSALCVIALLAAVSAVPAENLIANPGFEAGENHPADWNFNHRGTDGVIAWDDSRSAGGDRSSMLTNVEGQTGNVVQTVHLDPPLPPGSRVTYRAMVATENASKAPSIIMYLQPPGGSRQTVSAHGTAGTHDFVEVGDVAVADRQVGSIVMYLCHYGTGTAWWDDAFISVDRAEPTTVIDRPEGTEAVPALATADDLSVALNDAGGVASVRCGESALGAADMRSGLWVQPLGEDVVPVTGVSAADDGGLVQRWESDTRGLSVTANWSVTDDAITCRGEVADLTGEPRALDVVAALPVGAAGEGWTWGQSLIEELPIWETGEGEEPTAVPRGLDDHTFSALWRDDAGLSLAVPSDSPCVCRFEWNAEFGLSLRFRFGLSPEAAGDLQGRAPFAFSISRVDPAWGMRDAARRYQQRNPGAFEKRVEREGLWMFGQPRIELPDPYNYTFHEGGPNGWEFDEEHDIYTCPYIIPGQREITRLEKLPADAAEALELFRSWEPEDDRRAGRGWGNREIIDNCMLHNADGEPVVEIRNTSWGGNSITFPLNANPWLYGDSDRPTVAKKLLQHVASQHDETPELDGTYVDSLGHWGSFVNHRREHFSAERVPLTYEVISGSPVINNRFTLLEFLWELRDLLHERGKLLFANGVHPSRRFHFFALDIMGVEGHGRLHQKRTMAGSKPFLLLIYRIHEDPAKMRYWYNRCVHWGIYPSFGNMRLFDTQQKYAPIAELNDRFVPALRAVTGAGWRPITHAQITEGVLVERWGPDAEGDLYLTVYPDAESPQAAELTVDAAALGLDGDTLAAEDLLDGDTFEAPLADGSARLELPLEAERVRVLRLNAR